VHPESQGTEDLYQLMLRTLTGIKYTEGSGCDKLGA
jgi:hypothetical protein